MVNAANSTTSPTEGNDRVEVVTDGNSPIIRGGSRWKEKETVVVCKGFVKATLNPIEGANQKADVFFKSMTDACQKIRLEMIAKAVEDGEDEKNVIRTYYPVRSEHAWKGRFQAIKPVLAKFLAHVRRTPIPSGTNDPESKKLHFETTFLDHCENIGYRNRPKKVPLYECLQVLSELPVYARFESKEEGVSASDILETPKLGVKNKGDDLDANLDNPIGNKKAKHAKLLIAQVQSAVGTANKNSNSDFSSALAELSKSRDDKLAFQKMMFEEKSKRDNLKMILKYGGDDTPDSKRRKKDFTKMAIDAAKEEMEAKKVETEVKRLENELKLQRLRRQLEEEMNAVDGDN